MNKVKLLLLLFCAILYKSMAYAQEGTTTSEPPVPDDPRIEVITIIHFLSEDRNDPFFEKHYRQNKQAMFNKFRKHTAVKYWKAIHNKYNLYPFEVSVNLMLENGLFRIQSQQNNAFFTKLSEKERKEFVRLLNDFSHKSNLLSFCNRSIAYQ